MAYIDVITLPEAKKFLKIDEGMDLDDNLITLMIGAAFRYIEKRTNHIIYAKDKVYNVEDEGTDIYDYPINSVISPVDQYTDLRYGSRTKYYVDTEDRQLTLNVGYVNKVDVPESLISVAYQILDYWYYRNDKKISDASIPEMIKETIDVERRFV